MTEPRIPGPDQQADQAANAATPTDAQPHTQDTMAPGGTYGAPAGQPVTEYPAPTSAPAPVVIVKKKGPGWVALFCAMLVTIALTLGAVFYVRPELLRVSTPTNLNNGTVATVPASSDATDWTAVASAVSPAVVTISTQSASTGSTGSGVIYDAQGDIVTNYHVISSVVDGSGRIQVTLTDGRIYEAKIVGTDQSTDLAVIRLVNPPSDLVAAQFGQSSDLKVGQPVMAIGSPLGLSNTVTTGIISALNRPVQVQASESNDQGNSKDPFNQLQQQNNQAVTTNAIQVDASINPGNSGGPLFNEHGQVIGINSSIASLSSSSSSQAGSIGLGFAIPSDLVVSVVNQLIQNGTVDHARLGVSITTGAARVGNDTRAGAQISAVTQGSGAEAAGLRAGDVITAVDDNTVSSAQSLVGYVRRYMGGQEVKVTYVRDGVENTVHVKLQSEN